MVSNTKLFSIGNFDFRLQHLLIIGILSIAVSTSALLRAQPASYGFELNEFDPFFNYRATEFVVNNGYEAYFEWHDDKSWHPYGRNVSETSQVTLHLTTATLYKIFGSGFSLYDFTIMFPLIMGSLTSIVIFALVRVVGGTTAGLIASLMFAIASPVLLRGLIGWFKSEPLGLFFGFLALYLFLSGIKINKGKISLIKLLFSALIFALGFSSWGGVQFFILPLGLFFIALPFFRSDSKFLLWAIPTFSVSLLLITLLFERPPTTFIMGYGGFIIGLPTAFLVLILIIQKFSKETTKIRNSLITLGALTVSGIGIFLLGNVALPSFRYLSAMNPFMISGDPLTDSVSEHMATRLSDSYTHLSVFIIFGLIGAWLLFTYRSKNTNFSIPNDMRLFALIAGAVGIYVSSAFIRLELFGAFVLIILGSMGITILLRDILVKQTNIVKFTFCIVIIGLMITPMILPERYNWIDKGNLPPTLLHGGSYFWISTNDWHDATSWLKNNTPADAVIFSWWDYGYWIQTLGERTTLVDNATLITWQIEKVAKTFMSPSYDAWVILDSDYKTNVVEHYVGTPKHGSGSPIEIWGQPLTPEEYYIPECQIVNANCEFGQWHPQLTGLDSDYVLIYLAGQRFSIPGSPVWLYDLNGGGDESKKHWFAQIGGERQSTYLQSDGQTPTSHFWENTLLGKLIPFTVITYIDPATNLQFDSYREGSYPIYMKDIKFKDPDDPFTLVYSSSSFNEEREGPMSTILIYKVNHDYVQ